MSQWQQLVLLVVSGSLHLSIYSYVEGVQRLTVRATDKYRSPAKEPCQASKGMAHGNTDGCVNTARHPSKPTCQSTRQVAALVPVCKGLAPRLVSAI